MKHKLLKLNAVLLLGLGLTPLQGQTTMNVTTISNTQTNYTLSTIRKMTFPGTGYLSVTKTTASIDNYDLTSLRYLRFTNGLTDIESTFANTSYLFLYPNPVVDVLNIQLSETGIQTAIVELLSIDGKVLYKAQINKNNSLHQINISRFQQGIYLCRVNNGTSIKTNKFFKQ